ncbi:MAG: trigger factor, partial [Eubacterium sp.]
KTRTLRADAERAVIEFAIENAELEVPDLMIEEEVDRSMESMEQQMKAQGISLDDYFKFTGSSREDFRENMKPDAEKNIKMELVLADIAEAEAMAVTEEEMDAEIKVYADAFNHEFEAYKETVDDRMREYLDANIKRKKTVDFLVDAAVQK